MSRWCFTVSIALKEEKICYWIIGQTKYWKTKIYYCVLHQKGKKENIKLFSYIVCHSLSKWAWFRIQILYVSCRNDLLYELHSYLFAGKIYTFNKDTFFITLVISVQTHIPWMEVEIWLGYMTLDNIANTIFTDLEVTVERIRMKKIVCMYVYMYVHVI